MNVVDANRSNHLSVSVVNNYETEKVSTIKVFLDLVKQKYLLSHTLHLVLDGAGYHLSKEAKDKPAEWGITLDYLPICSPNLNLMVRLWKVMNEYARNNQYYSSAKDFWQHIIYFFNVTLTKIADTLNSRINDNFQVLKPASWSELAMYSEHMSW